MTVMDLFEIGGELTGLRRKETQKTKKGEGETSKAKELAQQIEHATESKWKGRLIKLLKLLSFPIRLKCQLRFVTFRIQ